MATPDDQALVAQPLETTDDRLEHLTHRALDALETVLRQNANQPLRMTAAREVLHAWSRSPRRLKEAQLSPEQEDARIVMALQNPDARMARLIRQAGLVLPSAEGKDK